MRTLETLATVSIVQRPTKADLIIAGPAGYFRNRQPLFLHHVPGVRNYIISNSQPLHVSNQQVTLFYSPEPPPIGYYRSSNCMYGVSSELITNDRSYFRLPLWMEGLDWSHYGIRGSTTDRVGIRPKPGDLVHERDPSPILMKQLSLALFTSHMNGMRTDVTQQLQEAAPIHGFGPFFNRDIPHHSESGFTKSEVLSNFAFNLCPENLIYPGYVTEKIFEAYICDTIPVTVADISGCSLDFNPECMINLYDHYADMANYFASILQDQERLAGVASRPLFIRAPVLDPFLAFLNQILSLF